MPITILRLGPDHPDALAWLWAHWGTTQALRHVATEAKPGRRQSVSSDATMVAITFWSADWTSWRALATLQERWPALCLTATPRYEFA